MPHAATGTATCGIDGRGRLVTRDEASDVVSFAAQAADTMEDAVRVVGFRCDGVAWVRGDQHFTLIDAFAVAVTEARAVLAT